MILSRSAPRLAFAASFALAAACAGAACGDGGGPHEASATGGNSGGGMPGPTSSAASSVATSSVSGSGGSNGDGGSCHGDDLTWKKLSSGPFACMASAECCVAFNPCLGEAQVVSADVLANAAAYWPYCDSACKDCIPSAVDVRCVDGACAGFLLPMTDPSSPLRMDHCGDDKLPPPPPPPMGPMPEQHFACGG
jgi:hypothetical protein